MRCWFLVLLLGLHHVTDFFPNAQTNKNRSRCETERYQETCHPVLAKRLSLVDLLWHDTLPPPLFSTISGTTENCEWPDAPVNPGDGGQKGVFDKRTIKTASQISGRKDDALKKDTEFNGPPKLDSFEKWKHSHLCRYLKEQRKQKQPTAAPTLVKINQESDPSRKDDYQPLMENNEQAPGEPDKSHSNQGASSGTKSNRIDVAQSQAEADFANHQELKALKKAPRQRKNFANANCGAKIVATNAQAQNAKEILSENRDGYMLNPCKAKIWFVIELCERIQIESVEIASFELFARVPKRFKVSTTEEFDPALMNGDPQLDMSEQQPAHKVPVRWYDLGTFSLQSPTREIHRFNVSSTAKQADEEATATTGSGDNNRGGLNGGVDVETKGGEHSRVANSHGYIYDLMGKSREEPYVKYVRFEMLEYEGTEHYCPLSLVRIYGSTLEEVINMREQADDSFIDAIVSMPGRPKSDEVVTTEKQHSDKNESRPSISHYIFMLAREDEKRGPVSFKLTNVHAGQTPSDHCRNPMNDVRMFQLMCSYQTHARQKMRGRGSHDHLQVVEDVSNRLVTLMDKLTGPETNHSTPHGIPTGADVNGEQTSLSELDPNATLKEANLSDISPPADPLKRHNASSLRPLKTGSAVSGGVSSQPVLVRYGNRLNLLELNATLYAIYLDQLTDHYNANMQDLSAKLQQISGELQAQARRSEQIAQFAQQQAARMALMEDRLREMQLKLDRYSYKGNLLPITVCCTFFLCLLTFLLCVAVNSHNLFQSHLEPRPGGQTDLLTTGEMSALMSYLRKAEEDLQCLGPIHFCAAPQEALASVTCEHPCSPRIFSTFKQDNAESALASSAQIETIHERNLGDCGVCSCRPILSNSLSNDFARLTAK